MAKFAILSLHYTITQPPAASLM